MQSVSNFRTDILCANFAYFLGAIGIISMSTNGEQVKA